MSVIYNLSIILGYRVDYSSRLVIGSTLIRICAFIYSSVSVGFSQSNIRITTGNSVTIRVEVLEGTLDPGDVINLRSFTVNNTAIAGR